MPPQIRRFPAADTADTVAAVAANAANADTPTLPPCFRQVVVSVTNRLTGEQAWFNDARTRKPQTFKTAAAPSLQSPMFRAEEATAGSPPAHHAHDPTEGGRNCDFCKWQQLTAQVGAVPKKDQRQSF